MEDIEKKRKARRDEFEKLLNDVREKEEIAEKGEKPVRGNKPANNKNRQSREHSLVLEKKRLEDEAKVRQIDNNLDKQITIALNEFQDVYSQMIKK